MQQACSHAEALSEQQVLLKRMLAVLTHSGDLVHDSFQHHIAAARTDKAHLTTRVPHLKGQLPYLARHMQLGCTCKDIGTMSFPRSLSGLAHMSDTCDVLQGKLLQLMADGRQSSSRQLQTQPSLRGLLTAPQPSGAFILSVASLDVTQAAVEPGNPRNG